MTDGEQTVTIYEEIPAGDTQKFYVEDRRDCVLPQTSLRVRVLESAEDYVYLNFHKMDSNNIPRINLRFTVRPESPGDSNPLNILDLTLNSGKAAGKSGNSMVMIIIAAAGGVC